MKKICYLAVLFPVLLSCNSENKTSIENNNNVLIVNVGVFEAESRYYSDTFEYTATLKPYREANLGATIPGRVEKIHFSKGEYVSKGSLVAELSSEPMVMAQVEKDAVEKDYQRVKRLREKGSVTQQDYDHVFAKYEASKSKLALLESNTRIRAPFSGIIAEHLVNEGENFMFSPGLKIGLSHTSGIVRLIQTNPLKVVFNVNEQDIRHFENGMSVDVSLDALPDEHIKAQIAQIGPLVSAMSRTAEVMVKIPNDEGKLMPGMFARVKIELPGDTLVFVPRHAVIQHERDDKHYVWVIDDGKAQQMPVVPVITRHGYTALEDFEEGRKIIVAGINRLVPGIEVKY